MVGHIFNLVLVALCSGKDAFKELSGHAGFSVEECVAGKAEQQWILSDGVVPGFSKTTNVQMGSNGKGGKGGCWEITGCSTSQGADVGCGFGCKALPAKGCASPCD
eukprot:gene25598-18212_t